jgi:hypothetical protein
MTATARSTPSAAARLRAVPWGPLAIWILVVASVVSWRRGVLFDGGLDPFVIGKALVASAAAGFAALRWLRAPARRRIGLIPAIAIGLIAGVSLLGALAEGDVVPSAVLVIRILLLAGTILLLLATTPSSVAFATLLAAMGAVGVVAAVSGLPSLAAEGRLFGGIPPLAPNELATLVLPPALGAVYWTVRNGLRWWMLALFASLAGTTFATGSRTALAVLAIGAVIALFAARPLSIGTSVLVIAAVPVAYAVVAFTDVLPDLISRGEDIERLLTLNSRTIAWEVVLSTPTDSWAWWIGRGLAVKTIAVDGQYWDEQVLDSSWISALAQSGVIGTALLAGLVVLALVQLARSERHRGLAMPLLVVIVLRGFLENGLVESSTSFALLFVIATAVDPGTREQFAPVDRTRTRLGPGPEPRIVAVPASWLADREPVSPQPAPAR